MGRRYRWILAIAAAVAVVTWSLLALRGPAAGRAPGRERGVVPPPEGRAAPPDGRANGAAAVRLVVRVEPADRGPEWTLEVRDSAGGVRVERGTGAGERVFAALPAGRVRCAVRAPGFVGETTRIEAIERRDCSGTLTLRAFGSVSGVVREGEAPVAGALVRLAMPPEATKLTLELAPEEGEPAIEWTAETDAHGGFRFERIPPARGYTLHAAHFDYPPVRVDDIGLAPGAEVRADIALERGGHLAGRILDHRGEPCAGVTVHVYEQKTQRNVTRWADEARARTERDGRFVTPALRSNSPRLLKAWILADDLHLVVQHETVPPEDGRKEVGDLRPLPGTVVFEADGELRDAASTLTVAAIGDPPGEGAVVVLDALPFTPDGRVSVAGLPAGKCDWVVNDANRRAIGRGQFRATGRDMLVRVGELAAAEPAEDDEPRAEWKSLRVSVADTGREGMLVVASGGGVVAWQRVAEGQTELTEMRLPAGDYRVYLCAGDRIGWRDVAHTLAADTTITLVPAQPARVVALRVLRGGAPVPGAEIWIRGFRRGATGRRVPWAQADANGRTLLHGLPPDATVLEIVALEEGSGRRYAIGIEGRDELTLDLDEAGGE